LKNLSTFKSQNFFSFSKKNWDSVVDQFNGSIFYSYSYIKYLELCNIDKNFKNYSYIIFNNHKPLVIVLLFAEKHNKKKQISIGNNTIQCPLYNPILTKDEIENLNKNILDNIDKTAVKENCILARFQISSFNFLVDKKKYFNFYEDYGYKNSLSEKSWFNFKCNKSLIIDLQEEKDLLYKNVRNTNKRYINKTRKDTSLFILDQKNIDKNLFKKYGEFHNQNKHNKRSFENFEFNLSLINEGKQTIFLCLSNTEIIGSLVILNLNEKAYVNSICKINNCVKVFPVHYLFWSSIEYFLNKKYKYFWIGEKANKNIKNLSDAEKNLSFFKEGWGGTEVQWTQVEKKFYE
tara:strand:+ start:2046 stop:3089 length:1044 start_codon:yes stop_codon:yes gene_type:complete